MALVVAIKIALFNCTAGKWRFDHPVTNERVSLQAPIPEGGVWEAFREVAG